MIKRQASALLLCSSLAILCAGCNLPGRPHAGPEVPRPEEVQTFRELYQQNCAACHGADGQRGPATNLANPEYQAWIDDTSLRHAIESGEKGSLMPAFSLHHGGNLTDLQMNILVSGIRTKWKTLPESASVAQLPYRAALAGDVKNGQAVYIAGCARCHGATAQRPGTAGSILDPAFLSLVTAQGIRTTIVAGRPDIGQPDWRNDIPGRPLTDVEITNVTAWLLTQRTPSSP